ncbi:exopolygalacturonase clone GBGE184-like [Diospyros lotus]|uniref:exopolygalacturonase clone GBGE184-like n=1 Tax=Diospyros lotus TaxID=55363 RepID=UPI0022575A39|nr:exopolygalacturonase clone GBGE184-like [Diospyros lotus]
MINSKGFHMKISDSSNFTVTNITVTAPGDSPNTDGIHISGSDLVSVSKSVIGTGDDCISIGDGTTNLAVSEITCGPGHGISIGSLGQRENEDSVRGVTVTNCTLSNTTNGARIKTWHDSPAIEASGIVFEDIVMNGVKNPIIIDQHYGAKNKPGASNVKVSDVHYKNIRGTTITNTVVALNCSDAVPCEGIEVMDVDFTLDAAVAATAKYPTLSNACTNAKAVFTGKQNPPPCL